MNQPIPVLIVEDLPTDAELSMREVRKILPGSEFLRVETKTDYLAALNSFCPELIISDYKLPQFDGLRALELALEYVPETPFIIVTGSMNEDTAVDCMRAGAWDYVIKEHIKRLGPAIANVMEQKRWRVQKRLADTERERLMTAIEQTGEVITITDTSGMIQYVNPAFEKITGYSRTEAVGKNMRLLKSGRQDAAFYQEMWATIKAGRPWENLVVNKRKDGTLYTEKASISAVHDAAGNIVNFVAVKQDITARLQLEDQLLQSHKMEAVGLLAGGVAHDFNNILTAIISYAEFIKKGLSPENALRSDAQEILTSAERAATLTRQLLAFSRRQILDPRVIDVNSIVSGIVKMLNRLIGENIVLDVKPALTPCLVQVDPGQLEQVIVNLAINARDAMPEGGTITLETGLTSGTEELYAAHPGMQRGTLICLKVSDNGSGMTGEIKKHIFEPFYTTKTMGKGTGLGLATVFGIVKQSGGEIEVNSEPGKGTTFYIYLPLAVNAVKTMQQELSEGKASASNGEVVLLVDDDETMRRLGERILKGYGYAVLTAASTTEALAVLERLDKPVDLLVTDVVMPGMSGRELALQAVRRKLAGKILYMSGHIETVMVKDGDLEPGLAFIQKPFTAEAFSVKLRDVLDGSAEQARA